MISVDKDKPGARLGRGTYGVVWKGVLNATGEEVAVKCFRAPASQEEGLQVGVLRELIYVKSIPSHPNIIRFLAIEWGNASGRVRVAMPLYPHDLRKFLEMRNGKRLDTSACLSIGEQLMSGLAHLHAYHIFHRDIKPNNILIDDAMRIVICDFSLASAFQHRFEHSLDVQTLWYRAPEILLGDEKYGKEIDVWSAGLVIGALMKGRDLCMGNCAYEQLIKYFQFFGTPTEEIWPGVSSLPHYTMVFPKYRPPEDVSAQFSQAQECPRLRELFLSCASYMRNGSCAL